MDSKNLKYFIAVAQYGSISQAAKAMYISQPQLSHIIKTIEEEIGFPLIQRTNQGSSLTRNGEEFLSYCTTLQQDMDNLNRFVSQVKHSGSRLTVSMTRFSHTAECFNDVCAKYDDKEKLLLRLQECSTMDVIDNVMSGYSAVGVLHVSSSEQALMQRSLELKKLVFRQVGSFRPYVCLSRDHPLLQNSPEELNVQDLLSCGFVRYIGQYEDFLYHVATENGLVDLNDSARIIFVNDRMEQMRLISETNYYTIGIPEFQYQGSLYDVASVPLKNCTEHINFGIVMKKSHRPSAIERDFIETVQKKYSSLQA